MHPISQCSTVPKHRAENNRLELWWDSPEFLVNGISGEIHYDIIDGPMLSRF